MVEIILIQITETKPDSWFWYGLSLLLAVTLIGIIWRFAYKVSGSLEELKNITARLSENDAVRKNDIQHIKQDIEELKSTSPRRRGQ